jgi:hypothetical protein
VNIRFHEIDDPRPHRHQFLSEFEDRSALSAAVQMYGGMGAFMEGNWIILTTWWRRRSLHRWPRGSIGNISCT